MRQLINGSTMFFWVNSAIAWAKIPAAVVLAFVFLQPPQIGKTNQYMMALMQAYNENENVPQAHGMGLQRQADQNTANVQSLQRRLDLLEAMHIDASLASMRATIEYDHALLMTIAGAMLLMLAGNVLGYFKINKRRKDDEDG